MNELKTKDGETIQVGDKAWFYDIVLNIIYPVIITEEMTKEKNKCIFSERKPAFSYREYLNTSQE